jgi:hypothetical protein
MFRKAMLFVGAVAVASTGFVACGGGGDRACASTLYASVQYKGTSGGGSSGGSRSGGSSGGVKAPSNSGTKSGSSSGTKSGSGVKAPTNSGAGKSTPPPNSGARPTSTPVGGVPRSIGGSRYTYHGSDGTTRVYVYHPASYWTHLGAADPFNPFDPRNFYNPFSPYFHHHIDC